MLVLVRTSNPGAADIEDLELARRRARCGSGSPRSSTSWGGAGSASRGLSDVGAVVGATEPRHLARARELMARAPFLLPGVGAQGGRVEDLAPAFAPGRAGGLVTRLAQHRGRPPARAAASPRRRRAPRPSACERPPGRSSERFAAVG